MNYFQNENIMNWKCLHLTHTSAQEYTQFVRANNRGCIALHQLFFIINIIVIIFIVVSLFFAIISVT